MILVFTYNKGGADCIDVGEEYWKGAFHVEFGYVKKVMNAP